MISVCLQILANLILVISCNDYNKPGKIQSKFQNGVLVNNRSLKVNLIKKCACSILSVVI